MKARSLRTQWDSVVNGGSIELIMSINLGSKIKGFLLSNRLILESGGFDDDDDDNDANWSRIVSKPSSLLSGNKYGGGGDCDVENRLESVDVDWSLLLSLLIDVDVDALNDGKVQRNNDDDNCNCCCNLLLQICGWIGVVIVDDGDVDDEENGCLFLMLLLLLLMLLSL